MTFSILRALHTIIGEALDDIERVYAAEGINVPPPTESSLQPPPDAAHRMKFPYASPPPSPNIATPPTGMPHIDFPALDTAYDPDSLSEKLTAHPEVVVAINRIVAASGQLSATVQTPFLSLCDASMAYHLPSCMRLLEASHTVEILRAAGVSGSHVKDISAQNGVEKNKLDNNYFATAHVLRLLATHHILREVTPDVFAINRISSLVDSGKSLQELKEFEIAGCPEVKYRDTDGIAAFVGLCTDELQKSSAYLTEAYLLSPSRQTREARDPTRAPFCFAFSCAGDAAGALLPQRTPSGSTDKGTGFFAWLEGEGDQHGPREIETGPTIEFPPARGATGVNHHSAGTKILSPNRNRFRLERFGKAMSGTGSWEAPGAVLGGFDWHSLPAGSLIVDVGGGIGSTSMLLATAFSPIPSDKDRGPGIGLKFIIQDRAVVVDMGEKAWRTKCPEYLDSGIATFQVHDFFTPQPIKNAAVFLLRVILHDWPDAFAQKILLRLREAATETTRLVIADFILPLACVDDIGSGTDGVLHDVQGAESKLAPAPLLANLGKASANAYWMDLTMQVTFNGQERTLREIVSLARSAGWKVTKVTKAEGSLFGHIVALPAAIPIQRRARAGSGSAFFDAGKLAVGSGISVDKHGRVDDDMEAMEREIVERAHSRCNTPTFGSRMDLPSVEETVARFGGGVRSKGRVVPPAVGTTRPGILKPSVVLTAPAKKKKPSPLSVLPPQSPTPPSPSHYSFAPRQATPSSPITRRMSHASLPRSQSQQQDTPPVTDIRQPPPSPMSPRHPTLSRRSSYAQLLHFPPSNIPVRQYPLEPPSPAFPNHPPPSPTTSRSPTMTRRASHAHLPQVPIRKRTGSTIGIPANSGIGGIGMGSVLLGNGGGVLNFGVGERNPSMPNTRPASGGIVLAAAARIDRDISTKTPSP